MALKCKMGVHEWNGCTCTACGETRNEQHDLKQDCMKCSICGKIVVTSRHDWSKDCEICSKCGKTREDRHIWDGCKCTQCEKTRDEQHNWEDNCEKCSVCGSTRYEQHEWDGCKCIKCGEIRDEQHEWDGCKCLKCSAINSEKHDWNKEECLKCGCLNIEKIIVTGGEFERKYIKVNVDSFFIGRYPVTQKQYEKVIGENPSQFKGLNNPVENVTFYDALEFCNKMSALEGFQKCYSGSEDNIKCDFSKNGYRLPTEAEWEYAARGGNSSKGFSFSGSNEINEVAVYFDNSGKSTKPVGGKKSNELGIYDMSGNVWEWCWDWFVDDNYKGQSTNNPTGPDTGTKRVTRGGCWGRSEEYSQNIYRYSLIPSDKGSGNGFRVVRSRRAEETQVETYVDDDDAILNRNAFSLN